MTEELSILLSFESVATFFDELKNPCSKCVQPIEQAIKKFSVDSEGLTSTKSSSEGDQFSGQSSSEKDIEKCYCEGFPCEQLLNLKRSTSQDDGKTDFSGDPKPPKRLPINAPLDKMAPKCTYTEEEIKEYVNIIEKALRDEMARRFPLHVTSSSEQSDKVDVCKFDDSGTDCHCIDDISLNEIRSLVFDQYSLIRQYEVSANPEQPQFDFKASSESLLRVSELSDSEEFELESQRRFWDREEFSYQSYEDNNWMTPSAYENLEFRCFPFGGESEYSFGAKNRQNQLDSSGNEVRSCGKSSQSCKLQDPSSVPIFNEILNELDCKEVKPFVIGYQGRSDLIGKWGDCLEIVEQVISESHMSLNSGTKLKKVLKVPRKIEEHDEERTLSCIRYDDFHPTDSKSALECRLPIPSDFAKTEERKFKSRSKMCHEPFEGICTVNTDDFDNLKRFDNIGKRGVASLCRKLTEWTHCVTKTLCGIQEHSHIVVQMPSFSYPKTLRNRAKMDFRNVQNLQFGRLSWLENKNAQVLYVCPNSDGSDNLEHILRDFIGTVRPDVCLDNLWILNSKKSSDPEHFENDCSSGIENIFSNPREYRRLRNLTAGRQAFILPGVMQKKDVFVACELKIAIMGVALKFQERFMIKSEFIKLLREWNIDCPPTLEVNKFHELCSGLARMIIEFPDHDTWLVKINIGFNGCHTAVYKSHNASVNHINRNECRCHIESEIKLCGFLTEILPAKLLLKSDVYKDFKHFVRDLERHGGIIQACPKYDYKTISLGILIEHDTAPANLLCAAEVVKFKDDIRNDVAYILPQNVVAMENLQELMEKIGIGLRQQGMVGFFGIDLIAFVNEFNEEKLWIVDLDPHYTNLESFHEWIKFCLRFGTSCDAISSTERNVTRENVREKSRRTERIMEKLTKNSDRYSVASGKLRSNGLARYPGNTLINVCRQHGMFYDHVEKRGCMLCPIDPEFRDICLISIYPTRQMAVRKFIEALRILHELSIDKHKATETNMLKLAREMALME